jgi:phenylalanyl-tRNA synthetase beta chain
MNISYRWLKEIAPTITESPQQVADRLAMLGAPVDEIVEVGEPLRDVVIGRTRSVQRHPNADRLSLCEVDAGGDVLQVVCGAPNVRADAFYPFAPVGATLPGGVVIRKAKIRGTESQGMLCSARELNLGRDHEGILELSGEFTPGQSFIEAVGLDDVRLVVDVTPNRGDLLSHWGIAREVAPGGQRDLRSRLAGGPLSLERDRNQARAGRITVRIDDAAACSRYIGVAIEGVEVRSSPEWLASRLRAIGARPINNVVDATNFVLHELGQPLHAFDLERLAGEQIIVRRAASGELVTTLDGEARKLEPSMLVIADGERPSAIAGVMGGQDSEVSALTTSILLECALFEPAQVRKTRTMLGLSTDASYRFERGVDRDLMVSAVQRAVELILATAGGHIVGGADVDTAPRERVSIRVRPARVAHVLGVAFEPEQLIDLLEPIGLAAVRDGSDLMVSVPGHRVHDVAREIDIIEEITRRHGYNSFPVELLPFRPSAVPEDALAELEGRLRDLLVGRGFMEARTAAFAPEAEGDVELMHPLSSAESRLRRALLPGLLKRIEYNLNRGLRDVRLFEIGTAFELGAPLPHESTRLAVAFTGLRTPPHWTGAQAEYDVWDLKGLVAEVGRLGGITEISHEAHADIAPAIATVLMDTARFAGTSSDRMAEILGGQLRSDYIDAPVWAGKFFGFEMVLPPAGYARERVAYAPLAQFPPIEQDLALVVPEATSSREIEAAIRRAGGLYLEEVSAFDLYRGAGLPIGTRSIAYRLRFRASDRTLTDTEADEAVRSILKRLKDDLGVERRG